METKEKIIVLVGGPSTEADVSRRTGSAIYKALIESGYTAELLELQPESVLMDIQKLGGTVVFNALHGKYGEDGAIQGLLEISGIPYTGSGISASAVCMNKKISKDVFVGANIPTARSKSYDGRTQKEADIVKDIQASFAFPVVVKAATQGSSIGVTIAKEANALQAAIEDSLRYDHTLVVENYLDGEEFTVAVVDGTAMPAILIRPHSGAYDYASKYTVGATEYLVPAPIGESLEMKLRAIAEDTYRAVQCSGVARVDIMTNAKGEPFVLEVNTVPGMTETSLVPKAAKAMGISFASLCEMILKTASTQKG